MAEKIMTPKFRASFVHVFNPTKGLGDKLKYSITMLFPKDTDISELKRICKAALKEKWGDKPPKNLRIPFRDGDEKEYEGYTGMIFCGASSIQRPGLIDEERNPIIDPEEFYSGCYARATLTAFAYQHKSGNTGVSLGLQNIQKLQDGEPLISRAKPEDDFEAVAKSEKDVKDNKDILDL